MEENNQESPDLRALLENEAMLRYVIRTMAGLPINDESHDEVKLYEQIKAANPNKTDLEITPKQIGYYASLFTTGYDTFGVEYFVKLQQTEPAVLYYGIVTLIEAFNSLPEETLQKYKDAEKFQDK